MAEIQTYPLEVNEKVATPHSRRNRMVKALGQLPLVLSLMNTGVLVDRVQCLNKTFESETAPHNDSHQAIDVGTFNIADGAFGIEGVSEILAKHKFTLLGMQEAPASSLGQLKQATGLDHVAVNWNHRDFSGYDGNVVLTDLKIAYREAYNLPSVSHHRQRSALFTILENEQGQQFVVVTAHLAAQNGILPGEAMTERLAQAQTLISILRGDSYRQLPQILLVDANEGPGLSSYQVLARALHDTTLDIKPPAGGLDTFESYETQIDYIFTKGFITGSVGIFGNGSSDHCGVSANLYVYQPASERVLYSPLTSHPQ